MAVGCGGGAAGVVPPVPWHERVGAGAALAGCSAGTGGPDVDLPAPVALPPKLQRGGPRALAWLGSARLCRLRRWPGSREELVRVRPGQRGRRAAGGPARLRFRLSDTRLPKLPLSSQQGGRNVPFCIFLSVGRNSV